MTDHSGGRSLVRRLFSRASLGAGLIAVSAVLGASACSGSGSGEGGCVSTRTYFEQEVWSSFMASNCTKCHTPDGVAVTEHKAKLVLEPPTYPGFIDANLATLKEVSKIQYENQSELLLKPLGKMGHVGGAVLQEGSAEYKALTELVSRLGGGDSCGDAPSGALNLVSTLDAPATLRKASLGLNGRLPTAAEGDAVSKGGDAALDAALDVLMKEDAFYDRIQELWNDILLTDRFLGYDRAALDFMNDTDYPGTRPYRDDKDPLHDSPEHTLVNNAIAREPLDLINYIIRNDRPFSEILTADYTVVNPYSAKAYSVKDATFKDATNTQEVVQAHVSLGDGTAVPHAGVLSTPAFLNRWQTTPTNRNRGRARRLFLFFLATDVLKLAERPVDATKVTAEENPTLNATTCTVCHKVIDPVAGGFRNYGEQDYEHFNAKQDWHDDMFPAGFGEAKMDPASYTKGLQWLGQKMVNDPRFAVGTVYTVYKGLTGHEPLPYPRNSDDASFAEKLEAWTAQDTFFRQTADAFQKSKFNFKTVVKAIVKSPYYRGAQGDPVAVYQQQDVGTAHLLTPEMLNRKIDAVTGYRWRKPYDWAKPHDWLLEDYKLLYGGMDSNDVPSRLVSPNSLIASVSGVMSNELACRLTAFDFTRTKPAASEVSPWYPDFSKKDVRHFFPYVDITEAPESSGHTVDGSVENIKKNIQYLHALLLGEKLDLNDPEIERTYQLFLDTWHELNMSGDKSLRWECSGRWNPEDGTDLAKEVQIGDDPNFTIRSWMAVVSYLLSDWRFLYE